MAGEYRNPRVHVCILERPEGEENNSSPEHVYQQLNGHKKHFSLEEDDELWLVIDKDCWTESMLSEVSAKCVQDGMLHMALSNPCFELWLLLHLVDIHSLSNKEKEEWAANRKTSKRTDPLLKKRLRKELGSYSESKYDTSLFLANVTKAIEQAKSLDTNPSDRWPQTLGTRVYLLAESIMNLNGNKSTEG